jgi:hypothetical protein
MSNPLCASNLIPELTGCPGLANLFGPILLAAYCAFSSHC